MNVGVRMMSTLYLMMHLYLGPRYVSECWSKDDEYTVLDDVFIYRTEYVSECWSKDDEYTVLDDMYLYIYDRVCE